MHGWAFALMLLIPGRRGCFFARSLFWFRYPAVVYPTAWRTVPLSPSSPNRKVEKLKAHETNIMKLLQKGEEEAAMSMQMLEGNVVEKPAAKGTSPESGSASAEEIEVRAREESSCLVLSSAVFARA